MKTIATLIILLSSQYGHNTGRMCVVDYINTYAPIAVEEMHKTGFPASVKLAQGILESGYGTSYLARVKNNHFGIKYRWYRLYKNYRVYCSAKESYKDHSDYLCERVPHLWDCGSDWVCWCEKLNKSGYAGSPDYGELLKTIIRDYKLFMLDKI